MKVEEQVLVAKDASIKLASARTNEKNGALKNIANALDKNRDKIIFANKKDVELAIKEKLNDALVKRLDVDDAKIDEMIKSVKGVMKLEDPVGKILSQTQLDEGLELYKITCPIGVIGIIFESRPDALVQISTLCLKSGNSVILKGGSEAKNTNRVLYEIIKKESEKLLPKGWAQLIETREDVKSILKLDEYIDLLVPRGSNSFVKFIQDNTRIPVLGHSSGICHVYVDSDADMKKAVDIALDAKCQYAAVCNAMETLLVQKDIAKKFLNEVVHHYLKYGVELRLDTKAMKIMKVKHDLIKKMDEKKWATEYNDLILSVGIVNDVDDAIRHINKYGSGHTDSIVTKNAKTAKKFIDGVDSSSIMWNCSTRFADGYRYGLGAEVGISTNKIHARGPVGLEGLMIYKYTLIGNGHIVEDYASGKKKFTHKKRC